jgi:hypothetical protein
VQEVLGRTTRVLSFHTTRTTQKKAPLTILLFRVTLKRPSSEPHGATRQPAIARTPAKRSAYQILSAFVLFVVTVIMVQFVSLIPISFNRPSTYRSHKSVTEDFLHDTAQVLHNLLNIQVQIAIKIGLQIIRLYSLQG